MKVEAVKIVTDSHLLTMTEEEIHEIGAVPVTQNMNLIVTPVGTLKEIDQVKGVDIVTAIDQVGINQVSVQKTP